ncbi:MAG TPA: hypothetical protein PK122_05960, partial [Candidatus Paceibacterota bacterium]|nr:hypothetical protein [Candidatus Paceibacterota bacterium]
DIMKNQKDTQKTETNHKGHKDVSNFTALLDKPFYEFVNKKTEKIITALYLVSDCMDNSDPIREKLRLIGVRLMSDIYHLSVASPVDRQTEIALPLSNISEIISLLKVSFMVGFISEMNALILQDELVKLATQLRESINQDKNYLLSLDSKMFAVEPIDSNKDNGRNNQLNMGSNLALNNSFYKGHKLDVSFINNLSPLENDVSNSKKTQRSSPSERNNRREKILSLIKGKKNISIKDISLSFPDCSEKTISRELNVLISKGHIKKTGAKRWSRYQIA